MATARLDVHLWDTETSHLVWAKKFMLPAQRSSFEFIDNEIFSPNFANIPSHISKQDFKTKFIDYTLSLNWNIFSQERVKELNQYYRDLFMTTAAAASVQETQTIVEKDLDKLVELVKAGDQQNLEKYFKNSTVYLQEQAATALGQTSMPVEKPTPSDETPPPESSAADLGALTVPGPEDISVNQAPDFPRPEDAGTKPPTADHRPVRTMEGMALAQAAALGNLPNGVKSVTSGLGGDRLIEPVPEPLFYPGDAHMEGENNAGIIFSRDELYRMRGHTKSGAVYLYAGRSSNDVQTADVSADGKSTAMKKPNNLIKDSAYVYISQKSDTDNLLRIAGGTYARAVGGTSPRQGQSLAAMKADNIVLMARESGIRLITGTDRTNSRGAEQYSKFGIDLIAGNDDSDLQPLVKGINLQKYLEGLSKSVDELRSILYKFITSQNDYNVALLDHDHYDPFAIWMGSMTGNPAAVNGGKGWFSTAVVEAGCKVLLETAQLQFHTINQLRNRINNDSNAFDNLGSYKILSEKNRTN